MKPVAVAAEEIPRRPAKRKVSLSSEASALIAGMLVVPEDQIGGIAADGTDGVNPWDELRTVFPETLWHAALEAGDVEFDPDAGT